MTTIDAFKTGKISHISIMAIAVTNLNASIIFKRVVIPWSDIYSINRKAFGKPGRKSATSGRTPSRRLSAILTAVFIVKNSLGRLDTVNAIRNRDKEA